MEDNMPARKVSSQNFNLALRTHAATRPGGHNGPPQNIDRGQFYHAVDEATAIEYKMDPQVTQEPTESGNTGP